MTDPTPTVEPDPRLRCSCQATGGACARRASAEDRLCDSCRAGCGLAFGDGAGHWLHVRGRLVAFR